MIFLLLHACGTSEVTAPPADESVDPGDTPPTDTGPADDTSPDTADTETIGDDANPSEPGNVLLRVQMGRAEPEISFWYGYCADRAAASCPEWSEAGTVVNQSAYDFDYVALTGSLLFDGLVDDDGDGAADKEIADEDSSGCYRTGDATATLDGRDVSNLIELIESETQGCVLGLSVDAAWTQVSASP